MVQLFGVAQEAPGIARETPYEKLVLAMKRRDARASICMEMV